MILPEFIPILNLRIELIDYLFVPNPDWVWRFTALNAVLAGSREATWWLYTVECGSVVWFALPFRYRLLDQLACGGATLSRSQGISLSSNGIVATRRDPVTMRSTVAA